jgi:hypothetical protein
MWRAQFGLCAELDELTVPQLTALCGRYGLDRKGVKADMVSRLCIAMCKDGPVTAAKLASEDAREAKRVELCGLKVPALKGLCDEHKLSKAGVKADMEALNIGGVVALEREANNRESFRKLTSACTQV